MPRSPGRRRPLLAVVHDVGSASPLMVLSAARRICDVVFVCDLRQERVAASIATADGHARILDIGGRTWQGALGAIASAAPDGVVTFSEYQLDLTSRIATALGLPFHGRATAAVLTDKLAQRRALARAAVDATPCALVHGDGAAALAAVGLPAVIKPRRGAGSADTIRVDTHEDFRAAVAALPRDRAFVAERLLAGDPAVAGRSCGDYVSVESVTTPAGGSRQVCVTGKFPLAPPFRETGMFLPSTLSERAESAVLALERAALRALGVRHGVTHTEIKLTADGPRVIEVNGRLGGYVPEILRRATGVDLVAIALQVALGREPAVAAPTFRDVTYQLFVTPPADAGTLVALDGLEAAAALPHVRRVDLRARPGQPLDWRHGTEGHLGVVYGSAPDHATLWAAVDAVAAALRPTYGAAGGTPAAVGAR